MSNPTDPARAPDSQPTPHDPGDTPAPARPAAGPAPFPAPVPVPDDSLFEAVAPPAEAAEPDLFAEPAPETVQPVPPEADGAAWPPKPASQPEPAPEAPSGRQFPAVADAEPLLKPDTGGRELPTGPEAADEALFAPPSAPLRPTASFHAEEADFGPDPWDAGAPPPPTPARTPPPLRVVTPAPAVADRPEPRAAPSRDYGAGAPPEAFAEGEADHAIKRPAFGVYLFFLGTFMLLVPAVIGVGLAYHQRDRAPGWLRSHYDFQVRTFWISVMVMAFTIVGFPFGFGPVLFMGLVVWVTLRCFVGMVRLHRGEPIYNPQTWMV